MSQPEPRTETGRPNELQKPDSTEVGRAVLTIGVLILIASGGCAMLAAHELATSEFLAGLDAGVIVAAGMLFVAISGFVVGAGFVYAGLKSRRRA